MLVCEKELTSRGQELRSRSDHFVSESPLFCYFDVSTNIYFLRFLFHENLLLFAVLISFLWALDFCNFFFTLHFLHHVFWMTMVDVLLSVSSPFAAGFQRRRRFSGGSIGQPEGIAGIPQEGRAASQVNGVWHIPVHVWTCVRFPR